MKKRNKKDYYDKNMELLKEKHKGKFPRMVKRYLAEKEEDEKRN